MESRGEPVAITHVEERVVPDNSFDDAYAIYLGLSYEPPLLWQEAFHRLMAREPEPRITSFVGPKLRVVVGPKDNLESVLRQVAHVVRKTNLELDLVDEM